jgi:heme A synthase
VSGRTSGFGLYFVSFVLLVAAGALIGGAAVTFLSSLTPLYVSLGLSVAAIACAMAALARHIRDDDA